VRVRSVTLPALALALALGLFVSARVDDVAADPRRFAVPPPETPTPARGPASGPSLAVHWRDPEEALVEARRDRKPILLDVEAGWSAWCTRMQRRTYGDPGVRADIARAFVATRVDAEEDRLRVRFEGRAMSHRAFADRFKVATYPTTVFLTPDGTPITRVPGYVGPARFRMLLRFVSEGRYRTQSWDEFAGPDPAAGDEGTPGDEERP